MLEQLLVRERVDEVFGKVKRLIWARSVVLSHVFAQRLRRRRAHRIQIKPLGRLVGAPRVPWRTTSISTRRFFGGAVADEDPRSMYAVTSPIAIGKRKGRSAPLCKKKSSSGGDEVLRRRGAKEGTFVVSQMEYVWSQVGT